MITGFSCPRAPLHGEKMGCQRDHHALDL